MIERPESAAVSRYGASRIARYTPAQAKSVFGQNAEFALLDVCEQEEFSRGHMLLASCAPLSRLELLAGDLVPCRRTPVVLTDSGQEGCRPRAERAARVLLAAGYENVGVLEGGVRAWREAGYVVVTGVGALSKAFGEYVEETDHTPRMEPRDIKNLLDAGEKAVVIDVRPFGEYTNMNIPGAVNAPGCEVLYRFADIVPDDETMVIINCAGRTRSIIGTQTLVNAGIPNRVAALKGGTMNWQLAGFPLAYGSRGTSAAPSAPALAIARKRAMAVAEACGVSFVDAAMLRFWQENRDQRSLYCFDVRQPEEFEAGHLPGSRNAPGGQLVQATDEFAAVRNGRFVLIDDTEVRAAITAHWLLQMGIADVHVLLGGLGGSGMGGRLEKGPTESVPLFAPGPVQFISSDEFARMMKGVSPPLLVNVGFSKKHREGHIPGSVWVARSYLESAWASHPDVGTVVVTADSEFHAGLAAADAGELWKSARVFALRGGNPDWAAKGLPLEAGMPRALCPEDDVWYRPYQDINASPKAMNEYFGWEFGLVSQVCEDGDVIFKRFASR